MQRMKLIFIIKILIIKICYEALTIVFLTMLTEENNGFLWRFMSQVPFSLFYLLSLSRNGLATSLRVLGIPVGTQV